MNNHQNFTDLVNTIATLRAPNGCPWDRKQTHETLKRYLVEETYEVLEAIRQADSEKLKEELGDLLLQIVLHAQIAKDNNLFSIEDVANSINEKMIERHPHVFKDQKAISVTEVLAQWEDLKPKSTSILGDIPYDLPALLQALKISEKACSFGFEWEAESHIWQQLTEEISEFKDAITKYRIQKSANLDTESTQQLFKNAELELGDILFTMVNLARFNKIDPEEALHLTIKKFKTRFAQMEKLSPKNLKELTVQEWNTLWLEAKASVG